MERSSGATPTTEVAWIDAAMSVVLATAIAFAMFPFVALVVLGPYALLWGRDEMWASLDAAFELPWFLPIFFLMIVVHEGLHGFGFWRFGRVPRGDISFGVKWLTVTPYTHCVVPMRAGAYRIAVALPALILGVLPSVVGVALGIGVLAAWGALMLGAAGGDLAVLWAIRAVPADAIVRDHPSKAGCQVRAD